MAGMGRKRTLASPDVTAINGGVCNRHEGTLKLSSAENTRCIEPAPKMMGGGVAMAASQLLTAALASASPNAHVTPGTPAIKFDLARTGATSPVSTVSNSSITWRQCEGGANDIVICAKRSHGYRPDLDVIEAKRTSQAPRRPQRSAHPSPPPNCATVGPEGCTGTPTVDLVRGAAVLATAAAKAVSHEDWRSAFRTKPDEYQLYVNAKAKREAEGK